MIKYPLYQFPANGVTPFDVYKTVAQGDAVLDAVEAQVKSCYDDYENSVNSASVHNLTPPWFCRSRKRKSKRSVQKRL